MAEYLANAKINLGLDITGVRENGYHDLRMVMQTLQLSDIVSVERDGAGRDIITETLKEGERGLVPDDRTNLAYRAARLLFDEFGIEEGIRIRIQKRIPIAAGLAGGSSDAAAVLRAVNDLFSLGLSLEELQSRGVTLGADIPYCLVGGTRIAEGIGEELTPVVPAMPVCPVLLIKPKAAVSTGAVYTAYDKGRQDFHPNIEKLVSAIRDGDLKLVGKSLGNVLEQVTVSMVPEIREVKQFLMGEGALGSLMSGSGPTVFGLFSDRENCGAAEDKARRTYPDMEVISTFIAG
ncbi:MAG: 4-(cytidine 5'-diphospho)-2-C-methyl-D-erythritol kinase [Lachnospiraceae bacterium]|nr:4-(cytidine 5'-diphospho)-2-C-methyl-D-erythritol kinase [Lachnospiraceae bacterium]